MYAKNITLFVLYVRNKLATFFDFLSFRPKWKILMNIKFFFLDIQHLLQQNIPYHCFGHNFLWSLHWIQIIFLSIQNLLQVIFETLLIHTNCLYLSTWVWWHNVFIITFHIFIICFSISMCCMAHSTSNAFFNYQ